MGHSFANILVLAIGSCGLWLDRALPETACVGTVASFTDKSRLCQSSCSSGSWWLDLLYDPPCSVNAVASVILWPVRLGHLVVAGEPCRRTGVFALGPEVALWHRDAFVWMLIHTVIFGRFNDLRFSAPLWLPINPDYTH